MLDLISVLGSRLFDCLLFSFVFLLFFFCLSTVWKGKLHSFFYVSKYKSTVFVLCEIIQAGRGVHSIHNGVEAGDLDSGLPSVCGRIHGPEMLLHY